MQKDRKKIHKEVVKYMRWRNKELATDAYIGLNRFRIDLAQESWYRFEDGSGGELFLTFKLTDLLTGNKACFMCNNFNYDYKLLMYANDFLIRCSSGNKGHHPPLHYVAYDIHTIIPYDKDDHEKKVIPDDDVLCRYNWLNYNILGD